MSPHPAGLVPCLLICLACATPGEKFQLASLPRQGRAHVYVYRTSDSNTQHDYGEIISLDGEEVGTLRATGMPWGQPGCQYLLLSVAPGYHRIQARSKDHWFTLIPENLMEEAITAEPDRVYFVRVRRVLLGISMQGGSSVTWSTNAGVSTSSSPITMQAFWDKELGQFTGDDPPADITRCEVINSSPE